MLVVPNMQQSKTVILLLFANSLATADYFYSRDTALLRQLSRAPTDQGFEMMNRRDKKRKERLSWEKPLHPKKARPDHADLEDWDKPRSGLARQKPDDISGEVTRRDSSVSRVREEESSESEGERGDEGYDDGEVFEGFPDCDGRNIERENAAGQGVTAIDQTPRASLVDADDGQKTSQKLLRHATLFRKTTFSTRHPSMAQLSIHHCDRPGTRGSARSAGTRRRTTTQRTTRSATEDARTDMIWFVRS